VVNLDTTTVVVNGARVHLTGKEYQMLELLSLRKGTTLTKEMFLNHLYGGMDEPEIKIIDVFMCKLRKKLAGAWNGKDYIETVWGRGYVLREPSPPNRFCRSLAVARCAARQLRAKWMVVLRPAGPASAATASKVRHLPRISAGRGRTNRGPQSYPRRR
jgi:hypothetical protein